MADEKSKEKKAKGKKEAKSEKRAKVPGGPLHQSKKPKKHAPDRKQPAWLFPPNDQNPVLNPKPKPEAQTAKETADRLQAISFLQHRAVGAPPRAPPPHDLLALLGAFLTAFGFNHTCRIFTQEWIAKAEILDDWVYENIGKKKFPKGMPTLLDIYNGWRREWDLEHGADASASDASAESEGGDVMPLDGKGERSEAGGSESDDSDAMSVDEKPAPKKAKAKAQKKEATKSNDAEKAAANGKSTSGLGKDDSETASTKKPKQPKASKVSMSSRPEAGLSEVKAKATSNAPAPKATSASSSSSATSDSDAHGKKSAEAPKAFKKGTIDSIVNTLKRKQSPIAASLDGKSKETQSNGAAVPTSHERPKKKARLQKEADEIDKLDVKPEKAKKSKTTAETPAALEDQPAPEPTTAKASKKRFKSKNASDAAGEIQPRAEQDITELSAAPHATNGNADATGITVAPDGGSADGAAPASLEDGASNTKAKKKKPNAPFQRVSSETMVDPRLASNAYVPNAYSDRAYQDLSVTKGKGFTKEKNKKKKGSYRGGMIDVDGGKGIKFDD